MIRSVALAACVSSLVACGGDAGTSTVPDRPVFIDSVLFHAETGVNGNRPVRVTLVQAQEMPLVSDLLRTLPSAWFGEAGEAFRAAHPRVYYDDWEVVPGTAPGPFPLAVSEWVSAVLFCAVASDAPAQRVETSGDLVIRISDAGCTVLEADAAPLPPEPESSPAPSPAPPTTSAQASGERRAEPSVLERFRSFLSGVFSGRE